MLWFIRLWECEHAFDLDRLVAVLCKSLCVCVCVKCFIRTFIAMVFELRCTFHYNSSDVQNFMYYIHNGI